MDFFLARNSYDSKELLTMAQIAELSGMSYWYIRALNSGSEKTKISFPQPDTKIGKRPLWRKFTITSWLEERERRA